MESEPFAMSVANTGTFDAFLKPQTGLEPPPQAAVFSTDDKSCRSDQSPPVRDSVVAGFVATAVV